MPTHRENVALLRYVACQSGKRGFIMRTHVHREFDPSALKQLYSAFDKAWDTIKDATAEADRDKVRDVVGCAIFGLARHGYSNTLHLARYGAYRGRQFLDLRC